MMKATHGDQWSGIHTPGNRRGVQGMMRTMMRGGEGGLGGGGHPHGAGAVRPDTLLIVRGVQKGPGAPLPDHDPGPLQGHPPVQGSATTLVPALHLVTDPTGGVMIMTVSAIEVVHVIGTSQATTGRIEGMVVGEVLMMRASRHHKHHHKSRSKRRSGLW